MNPSSLPITSLRGDLARVLRGHDRVIVQAPTGEYSQPTAYRKTITGVLKGMPLMWNVKKEA